MSFHTIKDLLTKTAVKDPGQIAKQPQFKPGGFGSKPNAGPPPAGIADSASGTPAVGPAGGIDQFKSRIGTERPAEKPVAPPAPKPAKPAWTPGSWKPGQALPSAANHSLVRGGKAGSSDNNWS